MSERFRIYDRDGRVMSQGAFNALMAERDRERQQLAALREANKEASEHLNQLLFILVENECDIDDWVIERTGTDIVKELEAIKVKLQADREGKNE